MTAGLRYGTLALITVAAGCAPAARTPMGPPADLQDAEHVNAPSVQSLDGFSQAVRAGVNLYVSGQVALDSTGRVVGDDLRGQLTQALVNLTTVLRAGRALPADVVHVTVYVVNYQPADYSVVRDALTAFTPPGQAPALTLIGVSALPAPGLRVAIDAVAHVRGQFIDRTRLPGAPLNPGR